MKKKILIYLYRNFSLRYVLDTGLLKLLSNKYEIVLVTKNNFASYYKKNLNNSIKVIGYEWNKFEKERKKFLFNRISILIRKLSSGKKIGLNKTTKVREIQYKNQLKEQKIFFYFCLFISKLLNISKLARIAYNFIEKKFIQKNFFDNLLNEIKPDLVLIGSCCIDHDAYISLSAKKLKIKLASIIYSWDNPSTKGLAICKPDIVFSWNQKMSYDIENFFEIEKNSIVETGILHWSNYKKNMIKKKKKNRDIIISFFSSAPANFENAYENLIDLLNYNIKDKNIKILARMHPSYFFEKKKINFNIQKEILRNYSGKIKFINPKIRIIGNDFLMDLKKDLKDLKNILIQSDIVITQYSTILLEALILKKPIINFSTGSFRKTLFSKKQIFSSMHHLNTLYEYNLYKDIDDKILLYKELDNLIKKSPNFINYKKFYKENLKSIEKNNVETLDKQLTKFLND